METVQFDIHDIRWDVQDEFGPAPKCAEIISGKSGAIRILYEDGDWGIYSFEHTEMGALPHFVEAWYLKPDGHRETLNIEVELIGNLSTFEAAQFTGLSHDRIMQACENGEIGKWHSSLFGKSGRWQIELQELLKWKIDRRRPGRPSKVKKSK